mmetsp:Transcript_38827/g.38382  ORF Transcript_38827/g.38382 Transcript_38827/m.38382 type:complete len:83 (-) Transcript_38827:150-398(-)
MSCSWRNLKNSPMHLRNKNPEMQKLFTATRNYLQGFVPEMWMCLRDVWSILKKHALLGQKIEHTPENLLTNDALLMITMMAS